MSRKRKSSKGRGCYTLSFPSSQPPSQPKKRKGIQSKCREYHDLDVPLLFDYSKTYAGTEESSDATKKNNQKYYHHHHNHVTLLHRLSQTGYSVVALSHSVHGSVEEKDHSDCAVPISSIIDSIDQQEEDEKKPNDKKTTDKAATTHATKKNNNSVLLKQINNMTILKRLNIIIEESSDLAHYTDSTSEHVKDILNSYDIIALFPQNETVYKTACSSSNLIYIDIITLDYTAGGRGILPYKLRTSDISTATTNGFTFEIPYSPSIIDPSKRKTFVHIGRTLSSISTIVGAVPVGQQNYDNQDNTTYGRVRMIISSGRRINSSINSSKDYSVMALRSAGDVMNLVKVLLDWNDQIVLQAFTQHASNAILKGKSRQAGTRILWPSDTNDLFRSFGLPTEVPSEDKMQDDAKPDKCDEMSKSDAEEEEDNGFIRF